MNNGGDAAAEDVSCRCRRCHCEPPCQQTIDDTKERPCETNRSSTKDQKTLHIAPMLHVSTVEFRTLFRILSRRCTLWTEMVVDETLFHNLSMKEEEDEENENTVDETATTPTSPSSHQRRQRPAVPYHLLAAPVSATDHPIVCQIGGIRPEWTAVATALVRDAGYDEINLNLDCPSARVQGKQFGARLLVDSAHTAVLLPLLQAMQSNCGGSSDGNSDTNDNGDTPLRHSSIPLSVKCRVGVVDNAHPDLHADNNYEWLQALIGRLSSSLPQAAGCHRFVLHARTVHLQGLSPLQNRSVPPLNYPFVYRLCRQFPECSFVLNGGVRNLRDAKAIVDGGVPLEIEHNSMEASSSSSSHTVPCTLCATPNGSCIAPPANAAPANLTGCMLGRAALDHPAQFWDVDRYWYGEPTNPVTCRRQVLDQYCAALAGLYPRRCGTDDTEDTVTQRLPAPRIVVTQPQHAVDRCRVCGGGRDDDGFGNSDREWSFLFRDDDEQTPRIKISSCVMDRALRPFLGMFYGQPGSKDFRRTCDRLSRNGRVRNCGPAFVLRQAVYATIAPEILDAPLVRTEDMPLVPER